MEFESQMLLTDDLLVGLQLAYIKSEVKEDLTLGETLVPIAVAGDGMPNIPEWSGAVNWDYGFDVSDSLRGYFRGILSFRDSTLVTIGDNNNSTDSYSLLNLRLGAFINESWDLAVYVNNATDERPSLTGPIAVDPEPNAFRNAETTLPPRTYGVTVSKNFY